MADSPWLTTEQAAQYLSYSVQTIRAACTSGVLKHVRMSGRTIRTTAAWLDEWLLAHAEGGAIETTTGQ